MTAAIDHWYTLHVRSFNPNLGYSGCDVQGPFDRSLLLVKVNQMLSGASDDGIGTFPLWGTVVRVGLANGVEYRHGEAGWAEAGPATGIADIPQYATGPLNSELAALGTLRGEVRREESLAALIGVSKDRGLWVEGLTRKREWCLQMLRAQESDFRADQAFLFDLSLTPEVTGVVDLTLGSRRAERKLGSDERPKPPAPGTLVRAGKPILGFRTWLLHVPSQVIGDGIVDAEPKLLGPNYSMYNAAFHEWADSAITAACLNFGHEAPSEDCGCGIYAHHDFESTEREFRFSHEKLGTSVRGVVLGSGEVLVHQKGWRAGNARVVAFDGEIDPKYLPALRRVSQRLDVPILSRERLMELASKKGDALRKSDLEGI